MLPRVQNWNILFVITFGLGLVAACSPSREGGPPSSVIESEPEVDERLTEIEVPRTTLEVEVTTFAKSAALESRSTTVGDSEREFLVQFPAEISGLTPVIIDFHGGGVSAIDQYFSSNFSRLSDRQEVVLVYPQANESTGSVWNTLHLQDGNKVAEVDDFSFIGSIIETLKLDPRVDASKIYVSGYSNGAAMAYQIACHLNSDIAGFVVMSGLFPVEDEHPCLITHETPGIIVNGARDRERPLSGIEGYTRSVREGASWWALQNGASEGVIETYAGVERTVYESASGTQIQLFVVENGEHVWFDFEVDGQPMTDFIWDFLSSYQTSAG
jgi:polyhydroxybutyrate depolymerase